MLIQRNVTFYKLLHFLYITDIQVNVFQILNSCHKIKLSMGEIFLNRTKIAKITGN